jgi:hypothetical protein
MGMRGSVQNMRVSFEEQFEVVGEDKYLYRRNQKGEPIPVTSEERERFVRQYLRRIWWIMGGMMIVLSVFFGLVIWQTVAADSELSDMLLYAGIIVIATIAVALMYWVRGAPARELQGRGAVGRERTSEEMRAIYFGKMTYGQLLAAGGFGMFLIVYRATSEDILSGWHRIWLFLGAGLVLLAVVQALRKWQFDQNAD